MSLTLCNYTEIWIFLLRLSIKMRNKADNTKVEILIFIN